MSYRLRELIRIGVPDRLLHFYSCPALDSSSPPPGPDYMKLAEQTSASQSEAANRQTYANRPDQFSAWGSTQWTPSTTIDPSTGKEVTSWAQVQSLNPEQQAALNSQMSTQRQRSDLANQMMGRVQSDFSQPFNWGALPGASQGPQMQNTGTYETQGYIPQTTQTTNEPAFAQQRQQYTQAMWDQMQPQHQQQEAAVRTQLMNQGLTAGSEAYNTELQRLAGTQAAERWNAVQAGGQEQQRMQQQMLAQQQQAFGQGQTAGTFYNQAGAQQFGQELAANQQNFGQQSAMADYQNQQRTRALAEQQLGRNMSLTEMNALNAGQNVAPPSMPNYMSSTGSQGTDYSAAGSNAYQAALNAYNADQQQQQSNMKGLFQLGGAAIGAFYGNPGLGAAAGGATYEFMG